MDSSTLRWTLILLGILVLGLIFLFGSPEKKKPKASRRKAAKRRAARQHAGVAERREPVIGDPSGDPDDASAKSGEQGELQIGGDGRSGASEARPARQPDRIVSLYVLARDNRMITGAELLQAAVKTGMDFGEMNIFHRTVEGDSRPVFSLANAAKPGHFDRDAWNEFETAALVLFTTLPNPLSALDAWDSMLTTARRIAGLLDAELQDEDHHPFSRQREAQMREEMREYDRKRAAKQG